MKYVFWLGTFLLGFFGFNCKTIEPNKNEVKVEDKNEAKAEKGLLDKDVADFLVAAADARMMGIKEGKLAGERGTTPDIKEYGKLMQKDQSLMLKTIKKLAKARKISLPRIISAEKEDGLKDLFAKQGTDFDSKFIKMMKIDHKRDIKDFKAAKDLKDKEVSMFAGQYLPLIQSHLDKLDALK